MTWHEFSKKSVQRSEIFSIEFKINCINEAKNSSQDKVSRKYQKTHQPWEAVDKYIFHRGACTNREGALVCYFGERGRTFREGVLIKEGTLTERVRYEQTVLASYKVAWVLEHCNRRKLQCSVNHAFTRLSHY